MIIRSNRTDGTEGYVYTKKNEKYNDAVVKTENEIGGHGCLFHIKLPEYVSIDGGCFSGSEQFPLLEDVMDILNKVFKDFNFSKRIVDKNLNLDRIKDV